MNRPNHQDRDFFIGQEVEHTPAYGRTTLFVIGVQPVEKILEIVQQSKQDSDCQKHITHIYFGADRSFPITITTNDYKNWSQWENMIEICLAHGFWCSLDINISQVEGLLESGLCENNQFIPMISAPIPYLSQLGYNAVLKIDDRDFNCSNPGVWCHYVNQLTDRSVFTDWSKYNQDQPL
jgi:hypothetical protein